jgi:hypothetical protein
MLTMFVAGSIGAVDRSRLHYLSDQARIPRLACSAAITIQSRSHFRSSVAIRPCYYDLYMLGTFCKLMPF